MPSKMQSFFDQALENLNILKVKAVISARSPCGSPSGVIAGPGGDCKVDEAVRSFSPPVEDLRQIRLS
jgi:hypothetical protein